MRSLANAKKTVNWSSYRLTRLPNRTNVDTEFELDHMLLSFFCFRKLQILVDDEEESVILLI